MYGNEDVITKQYGGSHQTSPETETRTTQLVAEKLEILDPTKARNIFHNLYHINTKTHNVSYPK